MSKDISQLVAELKEAAEEKLKLFQIEEFSDGFSNVDILRLIAQMEKMKEALEAIEDNPTMDSTGMNCSLNNWSSWAKNRAREALGEQ